MLQGPLMDFKNEETDNDVRDKTMKKSLFISQDMHGLDNTIF